MASGQQQVRNCGLQFNYPQKLNAAPNQQVNMEENASLVNPSDETTNPGPTFWWETKKQSTQLSHPHIFDTQKKWDAKYVLF